MKKMVGLMARRELVRAIAERYRASSKREREGILNEFVAVTGYHRKYSIRLLNASTSRTDRIVTPRHRVYDAAVREALLSVGSFGPRMRQTSKAASTILVDALERHGHFALETSVRTRVLSASAATFDRCWLNRAREAIGNRGTLALRRCFVSRLG